MNIMTCVLWHVAFACAFGTKAIKPRNASSAIFFTWSSSFFQHTNGLFGVCIYLLHVVVIVYLLHYLHELGVVFIGKGNYRLGGITLACFFKCPHRAARRREREAHFREQ